MQLEEQIERIRESLRQGRFTSEASVSNGIVLPILNALEWPIFETSIVTPQYSIESYRVDLALCHPSNHPAVFIEVKKVGLSEGADRQLFEYAFHAGVPMAILTDGQEWSFYLPGEQGKYYERRVYKLDLLEREISEANKRLNRYLSYAAVSSGDALRAARSDYKDIARIRVIEATLPQAWNALLEEQDSLLIDLLSEKVEDFCGYKPEPDVRSQFIEKLTSYGKLEKEKIPGITPTDIPSGSTKKHRQRNVEKFQFSFCGKRYEAGSAREVMIKVFQLLSKENSGFLERFAARKHGKKRRYLAQDKNELYTERPDLTKFAVEVVLGWWVGTNYSRRDIQKIINLAKEVAGTKLSSQINVKVD
jgi:hypothetical protein